MQDRINIAIDAMGGDNSPKKIIDGIKISLQKNQECFLIDLREESEIQKIPSLKNLNVFIRLIFTISNLINIIFTNEYYSFVFYILSVQFVAKIYIISFCSTI